MHILCDDCGKKQILNITASWKHLFSDNLGRSCKLCCRRCTQGRDRDLSFNGAGILSEHRLSVDNEKEVEALFNRLKKLKLLETKSFFKVVERLLNGD